VRDIEQLRLVLKRLRTVPSVLRAERAA
jgi:hypothetical protein